MKLNTRFFYWPRPFCLPRALPMPTNTPIPLRYLKKPATALSSFPKAMARLSFRQWARQVSSSVTRRCRK